MGERDVIRRSAAVKAAAKRIPFLSDKRLNANLEFAAGDMAEAYRIGAEEAQREIIVRLLAVKAETGREGT
jgi:hypothetical protein